MQKFKKLLAIGSSLLLVAGFVSLGAGPASADPPVDNTNGTSYWEAIYPGSDCYKDNGTYGAVTDSGMTVTLSGSYDWVALIVKGGAVDYGDGPGNKVYNNPSSGTPYSPPLNNGGQQAAVSHWIVCVGTPPLTEITPVEPNVSSNDVCGIANDTLTVQTSMVGVVYTVTWNGDHTLATVTASVSDASKYFFKAGATTSWQFAFTNVPCPPTVIEVVPAATFTDVCGTANDSVSTPADTDALDYTETWNDAHTTVTVTVVAIGNNVIQEGVTTSWTHTFTDEPCPTVIEVVPAATFTDLCGTANDSVSTPADTDALDYTETWNDAHTTVTVTVVAIGNNVIQEGVTTSWTHTFTDEPCPTITPLAPSAFDPTCPVGVEAGASGYIQLDLQDHLHYAIDGVSTTQARNELAPGTYTVSVTADSGFTLSGPSSWEMTINPAFCPPTLALLSTTASMQNITCSAAGSYTLADTEGIKWLVNGVLTPAGTYKVSDASTVNVEAQLVDDVNDGWEDGAQKTWTFDFTNPADCLPTLAFTGTSGTDLGLLLAGSLLLLGGVVVASERRLRITRN